jgi:hypothetical protein
MSWAEELEESKSPVKETTKAHAFFFKQSKPEEKEVGR